MIPKLDEKIGQSSEGKYKPVSLEEDAEEGKDFDDLDVQISKRPYCSRSELFTALNLILFFISLLIFYKSSSPFTGQNWALEQTSYYSPLFRRLKIPLIERVVQGTLFNENNLLLRQYPNAQVDEAWEAITDVGVVIINEEDVLRLGKDPKKAVKAPSHWGHGEKAFLAQPDGQHALHCLNAVRKYAYREHYFPSSTGDLLNEHHVNLTSSSPLAPFHQAHLSHCLHILLQTLTCDFSTDVITHNWMATQNYPFPDFAINKKCKDHSKILQWQTKARISEEMWMEMAARGPQVDEFVSDLPPKLKEWTESDGMGGQAENGH